MDNILGQYRRADTENFLKMASWAMENYLLVHPDVRDLYKEKLNTSFLKRLDPAGLHTCSYWYGSGNDNDTFLATEWDCQMKGSKPSYENVTLIVDIDLFKASSTDPHEENRYGIRDLLRRLNNE